MLALFSETEVSATGAGAISFIVEETLVSVSAVLALFSETEVSATGAGAISLIVEETSVSDRPKLKLRLRGNGDFSLRSCVVFVLFRGCTLGLLSGHAT